MIHSSNTQFFVMLSEIIAQFPHDLTIMDDILYAIV